ncbi:hypothetical protein GTZ99_09950 [Novosphingobium sp. FSY-8]|uniref:Porin n=1 Tax=Novosphingobium ovatum TaxID=1908523 RepID=A0ABW9XEA0_9SPHN|nr:DcaP family trimeric outer membrane transporter [Novosphingobium ovatum]NBC36879.1 hypothetical protein [Novosphingobium ovatum]
MRHSIKIATGLLMAASALATPGIAHAAAKKAHHKPSATAAREAALMARIEKLEAMVTQLQAGQTAAAQTRSAEAAATAQAAAAAQAQAAQALAAAQAASVKASAADTRVAAVERKPAPEGMRSGATTIKIGGFLKLTAANSNYDGGTVTTNTLGRDFYLPQTIPVVTPTSRSTSATDFSAKQTRLWLNLDTTVAGHSLKGYVETDFQTTASAVQSVTGGGSQRTTNGYTLALRRAYVQLDKWTFGQDWTTFQYTAALPESTDFVGATEGTIFVRQPQIRYSTKAGKGVMLHIAAENPESATATAGSATLAENGTDRLPDFTARVVLTGKNSELSVAGLVRQVRVENGGVGVSTTGMGVSAAGKIFLNSAKTADLRFMMTYGQNISRYVGLNFAPDAVLLPASNTLADVNVFASLVALRVGLTPTVRMNVMGSMQKVSYDGTLTAASIAAYNKKAWSAAVNLFYSPVKPLDIGIEYRHGVRELANGTSGALDRIEFAAKYNF